MSQDLQGRPVRTFGEAVRFLEMGIDYEKVRAWTYDRKRLDLRRTVDLLAALGDPHTRYRIVHVAGTKGKGSTAGAIAHLLRACGLRTALLTSPHLVTPRERVRVDGEKVCEADFLRLVQLMQPYVAAKRAEGRQEERRDPTYFEMLTALAFRHFADRRVDWAVVEVGLGGRLDSTNVVSPSCCVITSIGYDHMDKLGDTIEAIASEKGGILKPGVPVVLGRQRYGGAIETLRRIADERGCPRWEVGRELELTRSEPMSAPVDAPRAAVGWRFSLRTPGRDYEDLFTPMLGAHQLDNLAAAVGALEMASQLAGLAFEPAAVAGALAGFQVPGRMEVLQRSPAVILDVAHTVESVEAVLAALDTHFPGRRIHVVFGCSAGKDLEGMLRRLRGRCASFVATRAGLHRALPAEDVGAAAREAGLASESGGPRTVADSWQAFGAAVDEADAADLVWVTGSFFTAGEIRARWVEEHPEAED